MTRAPELPKEKSRDVRSLSLNEHLLTSDIAVHVHYRCAELGGLSLIVCAGIGCSLIDCTRAK